MSLSQVLGLSLIEIIGDTGVKNFSNNGGIFNLGVGISGYVGIFIMLIISLQNSTLLVVNNAWDGLNGILESLYAYFILGERLENSFQYLGLIFIIGGIWLLRIPLIKKTNFKWPKL
jgi:multidrug transporter EmrE-like cation transporter